MLLFTIVSALADPIHIERGRYALSNDQALSAREQALLAIEADREDWRAWHLYQGACTTLGMAPLCKADLELAGESVPTVDIVNTWFDFQTELADIDNLEGTDHPELRALATGALHESSLPEAAAATLLEAVRHARDEVELLSKEALATHPDHPEIQIALWDVEDPRFAKPRKRVLKAGKKLEGRSAVELYRWLRLFEAAKDRDRRQEVRALLVEAGEPMESKDAGPPMSLDASFTAADERIAAAAAPMNRDGALLQVQTRRRLLTGAFRQRLALHGDSRNPRSRLDRVTSETLIGEPIPPKMLALACKSVREESCGERPDLAAAYAARAERRKAEGKPEEALIDIVVATTIQPYAPPGWYLLRSELQSDPAAAFASRALAWELGGDEPEGGLGAGWPGPTEAGEEAALAAIELWTRQVGDAPEPPFDRDRAVRTLDTDRNDHKELRRMAFLEYLDGDRAEVDKLLGRFARLYPEDPMGHLALGMAMRRRGLWTEAEAAYRSAIALEDERAHNHDDEGARIDTKGTHVHGAEEEITFEPPPPEAWSGLAVVLAHLERLDEAKQMLEHLDEHDTESALIDLHRALVHQAMGEPDQALTALTLALKHRERLDAAGLKQLRIVVDEDPFFDELRGTSDFRRLMTQFYGRTGYAPVPVSDP